VSVDKSIVAQVYEKLMDVPHGKVTTYGELARVAKTAPRTVAYLMKTNPNAPGVPCHRVVMDNGMLGGYSGPGGARRKQELLQKEGVAVRKNRIINFKETFFLFDD
jgi:O-6-methylguanine DNA methyltransferase